MKTEYYCSSCKYFLAEEKIPNINKRHRRCGSVMRVLRHEEMAEEEVKEEE